MCKVDNYWHYCLVIISCFITRNRAGHYIFVVWLLPLLFSSPILSRRRLDVYHTSTHDVALVGIQNVAGVWNVPHATRWKYRTQKLRKNRHLHTIAQLCLHGYILATKACIDNRKKWLNSDMSSICPHSVVNFGPLAAGIDWWVWGTPENFNGFRLFASLLLNRGQPNFARCLTVSWAGTLYTFLGLLPLTEFCQVTLRPSLASHGTQAMGVG